MGFGEHTGGAVARISAAHTTVWILDLARIGDRIRDEPALLRLLAPSERLRADRSPSSALRGFYTASHVGLRSILATLCGPQAASREFAHTPTGKPFVPRGPEFNLSRSGPMALVAISEGARVGIDVERVRPVAIDDWAVRYPVLRFFAKNRDVNMPVKILQAWTRLEAWCKRRGLPVGALLDQAEERRFRGDEISAFAPASASELRDLDVSPGYFACCACDEHSGVVVKHFDLLGCRVGITEGHVREINSAGGRTRGG